MQEGTYVVLTCCVAEALMYQDSVIYERVNLLFTINPRLNPNIY
jgi:hypothetical protein